MLDRRMLDRWSFSKVTVTSSLLFVRSYRWRRAATLRWQFWVRWRKCLWAALCLTACWCTECPRSSPPGTPSPYWPGAPGWAKQTHPQLKRTHTHTPERLTLIRHRVCFYHLTARFWTSPFLSSNSLRIILTTCQSIHQSIQQSVHQYNNQYISLWACSQNKQLEWWGGVNWPSSRCRRPVWLNLFVAPSSSRSWP